MSCSVSRDHASFRRRKVNAAKPAFRFPAIPAVDRRQPLAEFPNRNISQNDGLARSVEFEGVNVVTATESFRYSTAPFLVPIFVGFSFAAVPNAADERRAA